MISRLLLHACVALSHRVWLLRFHRNTCIRLPLLRIPAGIIVRLCKPVLRSVILFVCRFRLRMAALFVSTFLLLKQKYRRKEAGKNGAYR